MWAFSLSPQSPLQMFDESTGAEAVVARGAASAGAGAECRGHASSAAFALRRLELGALTPATAEAIKPSGRSQLAAQNLTPAPPQPQQPVAAAQSQPQVPGVSNEALLCKLQEASRQHEALAAQAPRSPAVAPA